MTHQLDIDKEGNKHGDMTDSGKRYKLQGTVGQDKERDTTGETKGTREKGSFSFPCSLSDCSYRVV